MKLYLKEETRITDIVEKSRSIRLKYYPLNNFRIRKEIEISFTELLEQELLKRYLEIGAFKNLKDVIVIFIWKLDKNGQKGQLYGIQKIGRDTFFCLDYEYIIKSAEQIYE